MSLVALPSSSYRFGMSRDEPNTDNSIENNSHPGRDSALPLGLARRAGVWIDLDPLRAGRRPRFVGTLVLGSRIAGFSHGTDNERDWRQPGFGAETLRNWVQARNAETRPITWDLIVVAWDYSATERGGYPGYDDSKKNMPLPSGRNRAAVQLIREIANPRQLAGFSSDLFILQANSRSVPHDGPADAFYECLKRGEDYRAYYALPFQEIVAIYRELRDHQRCAVNRRSGF